MRSTGDTGAPDTGGEDTGGGDTGGEDTGGGAETGEPPDTGAGPPAQDTGTPDTSGRTGIPPSGAKNKGGDCSCATTGRTAMPLGLSLLALVGLRRRD